jgi:hypothetical protein
VEALLKLVPFVAFEAEFEACLPPTVVADFGTFAAATRDDVVEALAAMRSRAAASDAAGLMFLAGTLEHFLEHEPVTPREHPLLVALYLRHLARDAGTPDDPLSIADRMNEW